MDSIHNSRIQANVRRTDELLSKLSSFTNTSRLGKSRDVTSDFCLDDLRQSINSLEFNAKSPRPNAAISLDSPLSTATNLNFKHHDNNHALSNVENACTENGDEEEYLRSNHVRSNNDSKLLYHSSLSPLKATYENEESQIKLPIDTVLFDKLHASIQEQENKLAEWSTVVQKAAALKDNMSDDNDADIEELQNNGNEVVDLQISTLEDLSHDTAPHAFNDNKTIHKVSRILSERQLRLESDKLDFESKLTTSRNTRERFEQELQELTKKLHDARNEESTVNNKLHQITVELSSINDQLSVSNTLKNKINTNLHKMNEIEKRLIDGINELRQGINQQWKQFESRWKEWDLNDIATWITHHGLQNKYGKRELVQNMGNRLNITCGADLVKFNKNDWIQIGIQSARDRQYLRNAFGILSAPPLIREDFKCPLTKRIMTDPVIAADGYTYDRAAITQWFANKSNRKTVNEIQCVVSPLTADILSTDMVFSNHQLFKQIQDYMKANKISSSSIK